MAKRLLTTQKIVNLSSDPVSATAGEVYYNTSINSLKYYDGSEWSLIGSGGEGGASVTISETPPVSPELGDLWYESDTAKMFIYYDSTWVEIGGGGGSSIANLNDLEDVSISSLADNHILSYESTTSLWKNQGLAAAIQEIDGASSGIDADLLDGQHGSYYAPIDSPTFTGTVVFDDSTTSGSSIRIPHGVAPTVPTNGDIWTTTDGMYVRIDGETVGPLGSGGGGGGASVAYQNDAPTSPGVGDLWVDSDEVVTFLSSNDFAVKNSPPFTGAATFNDGTNIEGRITAQSGIFYIQAGINSSDTTAKLNISRNSTTATNISEFNVYSTLSNFSGRVSGQDPVSGNDLTTRNYVESLFVGQFFLGGM